MGPSSYGGIANRFHSLWIGSEFLEHCSVKNFKATSRFKTMQMATSMPLSAFPSLGWSLKLHSIPHSPSHSSLFSPLFSNLHIHKTFRTFAYTIALQATSLNLLEGDWLGLLHSLLMSPKFSLDFIPENQNLFANVLFKPPCPYHPEVFPFIPVSVQPFAHLNNSSHLHLLLYLTSH